MKYAAVYIYKKTRDKGQELRHSIRSLRNLTNWDGRVFVVGDSEDWFVNIRHISVDKRSGNPYQDAEHKWYTAVTHPAIPANFIAMNDDFIICKKTELKPLHGGEIIAEGTGYHATAKRKTRDYLIEQGVEKPLDYSVHTPMIMNKKKRLEVSKLVQSTYPSHPYLARTLYGNLYKVGGRFYKDKKIRDNKIVNGIFISTSEYIPALNKLFPEPSEFEIEGRKEKELTGKLPIPKIIHQIWIGPLPPPTRWMNTWRDKNPDWQYELWDNDRVFSLKWKNQHLINEYLRKCEEVEKTGKFVSARGTTYTGEKATLFAWHVISDLLRYEILYKYGGYMPGSDSECLKPIDAKFDGEDFGVYTVRTGNLYVKEMQNLKRKYPNKNPQGSDVLSWSRYAYENASPILACKPGNEFAGKLIDELHKLKPEDLGEAVDTTGNVFMGKMIRKYKPKDLKMIDYVKKANRINQNEFSIHYAGTTKNRYKEGR